MPEAIERVRMGDLAAEARALGPQVENAVLETIRSGWYVLGERVKEFEARFGAWLGAPVVGCASGTEAISLALTALGIDERRTVLTVANTCAPTAAGIRMTGARLRLVDVDPVHLLMDPDRLEAALAAGPVDAVVVVHLYGNVAPVDRIVELCRPRGIRVLEDCAQAHGARLGNAHVGTLSDAAAFSFYPSKNLGAYGDGGAVSTSDPALEARVRRLRNYGYDPARRDWALEEGINSRLDEVQAAILTAKLSHLEAWNRRRREIADRYDAELNSHPTIRPVPVPRETRPARHLYVIRCGNRDALRAHLTDMGVDSGIHYPHPLHLQPAYQTLGHEPGSLPVSEAASREVLSLPLHPFLADVEVDRVRRALRTFRERAA